MKTDKPTRIQINAKLDLSNKGGFTTTSLHLVSACKQLDKNDYITLDGSFCYPVSTLTAILATYQKDSIVHVHPQHGYKWEYVEIDCNSKNKGADAYTREYTPVYNVIALQERYNGNRHPEPSKQYLYPTTRTESMFVAELTTEEVTVEHASIDPWVNKASLHKLSQVDDAAGRGKYMVSAGDLATDGYRLHYNPNVPSRIVDWNAADCMHFITDGRKNDNAVTLDAKATRNLIAGCKQALKIKATGIYLSVNGSLDYRATDGDTEVTGKITDGYNHSGENILIYINPRYLMDAISLPGQVTMRISRNNAPVYFTDGTREAIVMPLHIDD